MATTNGTQIVLPHANNSDTPTTSTIKRKREDNNEGSTNAGVNSTSSTKESQALVRDLLDVLKGYDTTPSILTRQIPDDRASEPQVKRQKGENIHVPKTNILERVAANSYRDLSHVLKDIDTATADIIDILQLPNGASQYVPVPASQSELSMKVNAFKQRAHELVRRETSDAVTGDTVTKANSGAAVQVKANPDEKKVVLTLYGNAGGAKQLFSSFQIPTKIAGESKDIVQPIREAGLPNGISTTQIVPIHSTGLSSDTKRVPTLGEVFPTPIAVPAMLPPKPSKIATTRSATVGWYQPAANESIPRTASYFRQTISSGQWLDYSNAISLQNTKKKSRERGLSLGVSKVASFESENTESDAAKLEALFRSAYSGFAPTKDEAAAVVPVGTMNQMWWQSSGEKSFSRMVENFETLNSMATPDLDIEDDSDDDIKRFEKLVQELEDDPIDPSLLVPEAHAQKSIEEKDVEEILQGISELLETLNSYQRIRHSSLSSSNRPGGSLSVSDTGSSGTPSKPNDSEQSTYEIIKSQLTLMIATLPPYAVAKLDADRLSELSISTRIEVQMPENKGVMEEDEFALRAKAAAVSAAAAAARSAQPAVLHRPSQAALYGNQYAPAPRVVPNPATQYYNGAQTPIRPPSNSMQRPPATAPVSYQNSRPVANAPYRSTQNYGTPTYPHQAPRPVQQQHQQYAPQSQHQYSQHTPIAQPPYMRPAGQIYQQMPQSMGPVQMNGRYPNQQGYPHQSHQAAAPLNGMAYQYNNAANMQRQASPQKAMYNSPQPTQARQPYGTPTPANGMNRQPYQQPQSQSLGINGGGSHIPQPQFTQQPATTPGYQTFMTTSEQDNLMARQKAQLAQQQAAAQQQARNAMQASMGSPSRGQPNGTNPVAANS